MMIRGYEIGAKLIATVVAVIVLVLVVGLTVRSCDKRRSQAAQERVERSQSEAAANSAADAIEAVTRSGEATAASEELSRENERDIRAAEGASVKVGSGVDAAGRAALCKRAAYRNDPKCKRAVR
jgi:ABC-type protease/lipase transport system fused ATPase/permease subunit